MPKIYKHLNTNERDILAVLYDNALAILPLLLKS